MKNRSSANHAFNSSAVSPIGNIDHVPVGKDAPEYLDKFEGARAYLTATTIDRDELIASLLARVSLLENTVLGLMRVK
ncbi:hypothetical protein A7J57_10330 [Agrobacterium tumefaciens]|uniref:Uncharacterized protein n=2 Tax=Agrobacterium tumefaciens TaxID=358 RepID=A0A176X2V5_AGRTU|nr:hypothetical protein A7J57_10330 [Agrobacterium tumefaciens]